MTSSNEIYPLKVLFWEATLRCNAGCAFCGSRCGDSFHGDLDGEVVLKAFERIASAYDPSGIMVNVTGGEPLMRRDLFEIMERVRTLGFPWGMVTNGSLIDDSVIEKMRAAGMSTISISIDGLYDAHEKIRKLPDSFDRTITSIENMAKADFLDEIQITTVVTKNNIRSLEEMYAFFSRLPIDSWRIAIVDEIGRCEEQRHLLLDADDLRYLTDFFDAHMFGPLLITTSCSHYLGNADTLYRPDGFHCDTGKTVGSILADGSIFVCPNVPREKDLVQGNIKTDDFVDVWENGFQWFRDPSARKVGKCAECPSWEKCRGDSVHTWDFQRRVPKFCWKDHAEIRPHDYSLPDDIRSVVDQDVSRLTGFRISYGSGSLKTVFFIPRASEKLIHEFYWGKYHPLNLCEQMVGMIGFIDGEKAYVTDLITIPLKDRSENTAYFTDDLHQYMMGEVDLYNRNLSRCPDILTDREGRVSFLGYIHSHPVQLKTRLSLPDIELHRALRDHGPPELISGIINPQQEELCLYWDSIYSPADVVLLTDESGIGALYRRKADQSSV